ncbi:MAG: GNAT family N-acetyltransferase [Ignavibacteriales bacterium]|nr:GNAT family N-acetyltransferase [Ignavibacteriales bacterium]
MPLTFTPYSDAAREEVLKLWSEALPLDAITTDILESRVLLDENFDPQTFLLARENGKLTGFALGLYAKRMALGDADPDGKRSWITALGVSKEANLNEIGGRLISEVEQKFKGLGKKECFVSSYPPGYFTPGIDQKAYAPLLKLFTDSGYIAFHEAISMDAPIVTFTLTPAILEKQKKLESQGITIRPYMRTDLVKFLAFLEQTMPSDWVRVERRNLKKLTEGAFHTEQIFVVTKDDDIIGYCQFEGAHFGPFGVSDKFQGQGIGTVLLARTLERMRQEGHHDAWVMWTDDITAKVYEKFGFKETRRFSIVKKQLLPG